MRIRVQIEGNAGTSPNWIVHDHYDSPETGLQSGYPFPSASPYRLCGSRVIWVA